MATSADLGRKVREAREEAGLSQKALGEMLQPPRSHAAISDIERGETRVGATDISQIARILGKAITYFYGQEDVPRPSAVHGRGQLTDEAISDFRRRADEVLKQRRDSDD